jgi:hypothetical protein
MLLSSGARHDMPGFQAVVAALADDHHLAHAVMGQGSDRTHISATLEQHQSTAAIPTKPESNAL